MFINLDKAVIKNLTEAFVENGLSAEEAGTKAAQYLQDGMVLFNQRYAEIAAIPGPEGSERMMEMEKPVLDAQKALADVKAWAKQL